MGNCDSSPDDVYDSRRGRWYSSRNGGPWASQTQRVPIGNGMYRGDPMMMPYGPPGERMYSSSGMPPPGYSRYGGGGGDFYGGGPDPFPSRYGPGPFTR